jgi:hypothetical protein
MSRENPVSITAGRDDFEIAERELQSTEPLDEAWARLTEDRANEVVVVDILKSLFADLGCTREGLSAECHESICQIHGRCDGLNENDWMSVLQGVRAFESFGSVSFIHGETYVRLDDLHQQELKHTVVEIVTSLREAALNAADCRAKGFVGGDYAVDIRLDPSNRVLELSSPFGNTEGASCVYKILMDDVRSIPIPATVTDLPPFRVPLHFQ